MPYYFKRDTVEKSYVKFTFLGTGTSQGIPLIGCTCEVCTSDDSKDKRLRSSLLVQSGRTTVSIDVGPDFRYQMLRAKVNRMDAVIITHEHMDHTAGLDEVRAFNFIQGTPVKVYATERVQKRLKEQYSYIFNNSDYPGVPQIELITIDSKTPFTIGDITFQPIKVMHGQLPVLGFRVGDFTYITDANYIGETEKNLIKGSKHFVINALRKKNHHSHFTLSEAIELAQELKVPNTYLTHISHQLGKHKEVSKELPKGVELAWDEKVVELGVRNR